MRGTLEKLYRSQSNHHTGRKGAMWTTKAHIEYVDQSGGDFMLLKKLVFIDSEGKEWITPAGFVSDLSSIPRWLRWAVPKTILGKAPFLHDLNYRQNPYKITRKKADQLYYQGAIDEGMKKWRAGVLYRGLRLGGWFSWQSH